MEIYVRQLLMQMQIVLPELAMMQQLHTLLQIKNVRIILLNVNLMG